MTTTTSSITILKWVCALGCMARGKEGLYRVDTAREAEMEIIILWVSALGSGVQGLVHRVPG